VCVCVCNYVYVYVCVCVWGGGSAVAVLLQGSDQVLQGLRVLGLQQSVLPAEVCEVCEERVEVWVQAQRQRLPVVGPVEVGQGPEQQEEHFLDQEHEARGEGYSWERQTGWKGEVSRGSGGD